MPHCWSEPTHFKKKFCNICRKRLDDQYAFRCESNFYREIILFLLFYFIQKVFIFIVCEYYIHTDCQVLAVNDCCETATFVPSRSLSSVTHHHHWREGNKLKSYFLNTYFAVWFNLFIFLKLLLL